MDFSLRGTGESIWIRCQFGGHFPMQGFKKANVDSALSLRNFTWSTASIFSWTGFAVCGDIWRRRALWSLFRKLELKAHHCTRTSYWASFRRTNRTIANGIRRTRGITMRILKRSSFSLLTFSAFAGDSSSFPMNIPS